MSPFKSREEVESKMQGYLSISPSYWNLMNEDERKGYSFWKDHLEYCFKRYNFDGCKRAMNMIDNITALALNRAYPQMNLFTT